MAVLYRVADWDTYFENNRTRELKRMDWVPIPNKLDGDGYTELLSHPDGAAHFGAWVAIVEVASKCNPRGTLARDIPHPPAALGRTLLRPHDSASLSRITRIPQVVYEAVIPRLVSIGWLVPEVVASSTVTEIPQEGAGIPQEGAALTRARGTERNGTERKGTEPLSAGADDDEGRKGAAVNGKAKAKGKPKADAKPEVAEVRSHFTSAWNRRYGGTYAWKHGKDDAHARWILDRPDVANNVEKAKAVVDAYFATEDAWYVERRHPIGLLVSGFNRFSTDPPDPFGPSDFEPTDAILSLIPGPQPVVGSPIE